MRLSKALRIARRALWARLRGDREGARRHFRRLLFMAARGHAELVTFRRGELVWTVPVGPDSIAKSLFVQGTHQGRELEAVLAWLSKRDRLGPRHSTLVDVGANLGTPSIALARATGKRVLAIEPMPEHFALLCRNVAANGLEDSIACLQAAISTQPGEVEMVWHPRGGSCEVRAPGDTQGFGPRGAEHRVVRVPALGLEEALRRQAIAPAEVGLVWSDTQGHERQVVETGVALWAAGAALFVELWPQGLRAHGGVERFVEAAKRHFVELVTRADLRAHGAAAEAQPISELPRVLEALGSRHSDALLLPPRSV